MDDAELNLAITGFGRVEAAAAAQRLASIAELTTRRLGSEAGHAREYWACDAWDSCAAEVSADLMIGHRKASVLMHQGLALRDRVPRVGALLARGDITLGVATTITWRTHLIEDPDLLARVDADIAATATRFGAMSEQKLNDAVDAAVERHDPDAVRRFRAAQRGLDVRFGKPDDATGTRSVFGRVSVVDAELSERRLESLARSVCPDDPRTHGQRRTEAWGVIAAGGDVLPCVCANPDCPAPAGPDPRAKHLDILVLTDHPDTDPESEPTPAPAPCSATSIIAGGGVIPAALLADLRRMGACVRPVVAPEDLTAEPRYRPSTAQQRLIRARDLTCRFTGCDHPAEYGDLDHTIPYGANGLTHPGNIETLCRKHHMLRTFWVGRGGWTDEQLPDGTIVWTSPSGLKHRAPPGSRIFFPNRDTTTPLPATPAPFTATSPCRELRMPLRTRTRAQQQRDGIRAERERNRRLGDDNPAPF